jgi:hypothetical protein
MLGAVTPTLYVVPGSHPCAAVRAALALKGMESYTEGADLPVPTAIARPGLPRDH